jgi:hypothetical protein
LRYAQDGALTAEGRRRWEQVRLEAVKSFERRVSAAVIAAELHRDCVRTADVIQP